MLIKYIALQAFVSCGYGVHMIGYVMITYGVCDAIFSLASGQIVKCMGRVPVFTLGAVLNAVLIGVALLWKPTPVMPFLFFLYAGVWGIGDAIWQTQINGMFLI